MLGEGCPVRNAGSGMLCQGFSLRDALPGMLGRECSSRDALSRTPGQEFWSGMLGQGSSVRDVGQGCCAGNSRPEMLRILPELWHPPSSKVSAVPGCAQLLARQGEHGEHGEQDLCVRKGAEGVIAAVNGS